jgi:tyrosyl-tRNA synthetase
MAAQIARYLHQSLTEIEDWDVPTFFRYFDHVEEVLQIEAEAKKTKSDE